MALSDVKCRQSKPTDKPFRLHDAQGLYLEIRPNGSKLWRLKYRHDGRARLLALGKYPIVTLERVRKLVYEARGLISEGVDPVEAKRAIESERLALTEHTFEAIAREWFEGKAPTWAAGHAKRLMQRLEADVFNRVGSRPISELNAPELLAMLRQIETRGAVETAHRVRRTCGQIFRYAIATGRAERDPAADLVGALKPYKNEHFAAVTDPIRLGAVLRTLHGYTGTDVVTSALKVLPMLLVRPGELRAAKWADIDLDAGEWRFQPSKMRKYKLELIVPLATQVIEVLRDLNDSTGGGDYVFPSPRSRDKAMSENAMRGAMLGLGLEGSEVTAHGFRATARTLLDEVLKVRPEFIEHQLGHTVRDPLGRAYNRTTFLPERRLMMQQWADYLQRLRVGASIETLGVLNVA
jgi:integrase